MSRWCLALLAVWTAAIAQDSIPSPDGRFVAYLTLNPTHGIGKRLFVKFAGDQGFRAHVTRERPLYGCGLVTRLEVSRRHQSYRPAHYSCPSVPDQRPWEHPRCAVVLHLTGSRCLGYQVVRFRLGHVAPRNSP